jgi:ectoine hydroxylase-related dioxygenase (phytanoyl-CoA dioxygenase family)
MSSKKAAIGYEDRIQLHRDGAVLLKNVISASMLNILESGLEHIEANPDGMSAGIGLPLRIDQFPGRHVPAIQAFLEQSPVAELVSTALEAPITFYMDQTFYKPAGVMAPSAWHQDTCYYNVSGHQLIRAWVCVDPVPRSASLEVVRGSHLWNITYRPPVGMDPDSDPERAAELQARFDRGERLIGSEAYDQWTYFDSFLDPSLPELPKIESARDSFDILGWDYEPGDVILFHGHVLHSARGGTHLPHPRRAHASLWAGPDVHYLRRRSQAIPDPIGLYDHDPHDGQHLTEFPNVFPIAWPPKP